jgi:hypothetical protein
MENLNPTLRHVLDPTSNKWSAIGVARLFLFFVLLPLCLAGMVWAAITETDWGRVTDAAVAIGWGLVSALGWVFQELRSITGTEWLLVCILLVLLRIANHILELNSTVSELLDEWRNERYEEEGEDYSD